MDFEKTNVTLGRPIWSYSKVQRFVSRVIRGRPMFFKSFPSVPFLVDIGPGSNISSEFYNIDFDWRPGIDRCVDITKGIGLPHARVAGVFSEHCFEHIDIELFSAVLAEIRNSMIEGAVIRIVMPDLEIYARKYIESIDGTQNVMPYRSTSLDGLSTPAVPFNVIMREHGHRFVYDFNTLRAALQRVGFRSIVKCTFGQGRDSRLLRDSAHRRIESLYAEAVK